jgi:hypothetical protein
MEVKGESYHVIYDPTTAVLAFQGALRMRGMVEYAPIMQLMDKVAALAPTTITMDLRDLQFSNSSGISVLFQFVIKMREQGSSNFIVRGSEQVFWQQKSLQNLQRLMAGMQLEWSE